jgi:hypothetical protein
VVTRLDVQSYRGRNNELVRVGSGSVLQKDSLEQVVNVEVQLPERPEEDVLARVHHWRPGGSSDPHVSSVVPALNCGGECRKLTERIDTVEVAIEGLDAHVLELLLIERLDGRVDLRQDDRLEVADYPVVEEEEPVTPTGCDVPVVVDIAKTLQEAAGVLRRRPGERDKPIPYLSVGHSNLLAWRHSSLSETTSSTTYQRKSSVSLFHN